MKQLTVICQNVTERTNKKSKPQTIRGLEYVAFTRHFQMYFCIYLQLPTHREECERVRKSERARENVSECMLYITSKYIMVLSRVQTANVYVIEWICEFIW